MSGDLAHEGKAARVSTHETDASRPDTVDLHLKRHVVAALFELAFDGSACDACVEGRRDVADEEREQAHACVDVLKGDLRGEPFRVLARLAEADARQLYAREPRGREVDDLKLVAARFTLS